MNKIILFIGIIGLLLISGCQQPQQCYIDCPDCICDCTPDTRSITKFEYPDSITLFNEYGLITDEEVIDDYYIKYFRIRIRAWEDGLKQGRICVEHKFDDVEIEDLSLMPIPDDYIIRNRDYRVDCWQYGDLDDYEIHTYDMGMKQGINQNQTVKISIWEETE